MENTLAILLKRDRNHPRRRPLIPKLAPGFSLLEIMTVVSLLLLVMTISAPIYQSAITRTREASLRSDLFTMRTMIDRFTLDNHRGPASLQELVEKGYMGSLPRDPFTGSTETWQVETTPAPPDPGGELKDASDLSDDSAPPGFANVHSGSNDMSLEGTPYSAW